MIKINTVDKLHRNILNELNKKKSHGTVLVYNDNCFHCAAMKPQWDEMKRRLNTKPANIYEINSNELEHVEHPIRNVVDGFPTILNVNNRNIVPFNEERTLDNMIKFVENNLGAQKKPPSNISNETMRKIKKVRFNRHSIPHHEKNLEIGDSLDLNKYLKMKLPKRKNHKRKSITKSKAKKSKVKKSKVKKSKVKKSKVKKSKVKRIKIKGESKRKTSNKKQNKR